MKILGKRLLVKLSEPEEKSAGGIILTTKIQRNMGTIEHLGDEIDHKDLEIGKTVIFDSVKGAQYNIEGQSYILFNQEDIIVILD